MNKRLEITQMHAYMCSAVSEPSRILIVYELARGPKNVSSLAKAIDLSHSATSRHLKILRESEFVTAKRRGHKVVYSLTSPKLIKALDILLDILNNQIAHRANLLKVDENNEKQ